MSFTGKTIILDFQPFILKVCSMLLPIILDFLPSFNQRTRQHRQFSSNHVQSLLKWGRDFLLDHFYLYIGVDDDWAYIEIHQFCGWRRASIWLNGFYFYITKVFQLTAATNTPEFTKTNNGEKTVKRKFGLKWNIPIKEIFASPAIFGLCLFALLVTNWSLIVMRSSTKKNHFIFIAGNRFSWTDCKNCGVSRSIIWLCHLQRLFYSSHHLISFSQQNKLGEHWQLACSIFIIQKVWGLSKQSFGIESCSVAISSAERAARFHLEQFYHSCCGMKNCEPRYQFSKLITELVVHISSWKFKCWIRWDEILNSLAGMSNFCEFAPWLLYLENHFIPFFVGRVFLSPA